MRPYGGTGFSVFPDGRTEGGNNVTDSENISLLAARDERGIVALEDKYSLYCQKIAFNILGDREEARECVNDAFLRVWNAAEREKPEKLTT